MKVFLSNSVVEINKVTKYITCDLLDDQPIINIYAIGCSNELEIISIHPKTKELAEKDYAKLAKVIKTLHPNAIKDTPEQ